jgi:hypothetical protein
MGWSLLEIGKGPQLTLEEELPENRWGQVDRP